MHDYMAFDKFRPPPQSSAVPSEVTTMTDEIFAVGGGAVSAPRHASCTGGSGDVNYIHTVPARSGNGPRIWKGHPKVEIFSF